MFTVQVTLVILKGWLAKVMVQKRPYGISKTATRKIFQGMATFVTGSIIVLLVFNNCNITFVTILQPLISFFSIFVAGGEMMLPHDLSDEYPATIMAIANSIANTSGALVTLFTGIVLGDKGGSQARWNTVILTVGAVDIFGGLMFNLLI